MGSRWKEGFVELLLLVLLALVALGLGAVLLLVGYRFFLLLLPIWGFVAGLWLGAETVSILLGEGFLVSVTGLVVGFVVGLIMAVLSYLFYAVGVLLLGASFGYWLAAGLMYAVGFESGFLVTVVGAITAIIFATLTVMVDVKKHLAIIMTAFGGAGGIALAILLIFGAITLEQLQAGAAAALAALIEDSVFWLLIWLALAIGGIIFQESNTREYYIEYDRQYGS
jgi:hypothetical protein